MEKQSLIKKNKYEFFIFILALLISLPIIYAMLTHRVIQGDDMFFHAGRIRSIAWEMPEQFPVYMCRDWLEGLGVPATIFYPSLFLYIPALFFKLGLSIETVYDGFLILIVFSMAFLSYKGFLELFGAEKEKHAAIATACFLFHPYLFNDLLHRAAIGELLAMTFMPLAIAQLSNLSDNNILKTILVFTCIIQSHILSTILLIAMVISYALWNIRTFKWKALYKVTLGTILLNAFFIVPFIHQYFAVDVWIKYIIQPPISHETWLKLFIPIFAIEIIECIIALIYGTTKHFWTIFSISVILTLFASDIIHSNIITRIFQFPSRLLIIQSYFSAISPFFVASRHDKYPIPFGMCPRPTYRDRGVSSSTNIMRIMLATAAQLIRFHKCVSPSKFLPLAPVLLRLMIVFVWLPHLQISTLTFTDRLNYIDYAPHSISIETFQRWKTEGIPAGTLPIIYYAGYEATDENGDVIPIKPASNGLSKTGIELPRTVTIAYKGLPEYRIANLISVITLILIWRYSKRWNTKNY